MRGREGVGATNLWPSVLSEGGGRGQLGCPVELALEFALLLARCAPRPPLLRPRGPVQRNRAAQLGPRRVIAQADHPEAGLPEGTLLRGAPLQEALHQLQEALRQEARDTARCPVRVLENPRIRSVQWHPCP